MRVQALILRLLTLAVTIVTSVQGAETAELRLAKFDIDVTPPVGFMMAYDRVARLEELTLRCRGIVLRPGDAKAIVLCAVDWIGIANEGHDEFKRRLAAAAETTPDRVAVHTLHQHDAPRCDLSAEQILLAEGTGNTGAFESSLCREVLTTLETAVRQACTSMELVSKIGFGKAKVEQVASNRRILDETGTQVIATRYTTCRDPKLRALPEGVVDNEVSCVSFWKDETLLASLTYYACHPQSYYRTGIPSPDFPGIARFMRGQDKPEALHIHFNGAGGNVGAGKYNDGSKKNRLILAARLARGMEAAFEATELVEVNQIGWQTVDVDLPPAEHLNEEELKSQLANWGEGNYWGGPEKLAWLRRCKAGHKISLSCLSLGPIRVLHMPGELFVEYQLAAKAMRKDLHVTMAAYGDYGPGYIGTERSYSQGGYETSKRASNVAPQSERILLEGMRQLLDVTK